MNEPTSWGIEFHSRSIASSAYHRAMRYWAYSSLALVALVGCAPGSDIDAGGGGSTNSGTSSGVQCNSPKPDADGDGIADVDEGANESPPRDTDGDGQPDYLDADSDNDGIPDSIEGRNESTCEPPVDTDGDGKPDFEDTDSDSPTNDSIPDALEAGADPTHPVDTDGDGSPDYMDVDNDGDGIPDETELTPQGGTLPATTFAAAPDTDGDGTPDIFDLDSDGDGIPDLTEGAGDPDGDGVPNFRDLDADGDCIPDQLEGAVDTDGDGAPDFLDLDSDGDGLTDQSEDVNCNGVADPCETDRDNEDTDGDGVVDLIEVEDCAVKPPEQQIALNCKCDGTDPTVSPLTHGDFVFVVDYMAPPDPERLTLNLTTNVTQADVVFALDTTGSMTGSLTTMASTIASTIIPQAQATIPNMAFGVADYKDFFDTWVTRYDHRIQTVSTPEGIASLQGVLSGQFASGGGDGPEAGWEMLYAIAGGPPISVNGYNSQFDLASTFPTTPTPGESFGTLYGAGFRTGSVPIVMMVTDADSHDAPGVPQSGEDGLNDYDSSENGAPSRAMALAQMNANGIHVMGGAGLGFSQSGDPKARGIATAQATGAVVDPADFGDVATRPAGCALSQCCTGQNGVGEAPDGTGKCPLEFSFDDSSGNGLSGAVVSGIKALANGLKFDIHVQANDVDPSVVDNFIDRLEPNVSGTGPAALCVVVPLSSLQDNFSGPKATAGADTVLDTFPGIGGGLEICFDVVPKENTTVMNTTVTQFFRAQLQVIGIANGATINLGTPRDVFFLVPPKIDNVPQ